MQATELGTFIRSRLKVRQMILLVHLEEQQSIIRAAEAAGMTQPAASKLLSELEDALGVPLFDRHARGVIPTWYGDILIRHSRTALSEIRRAEEEINALRNGFSGQAAIGTVLNPGTNLVPTAVALLKSRDSQIKVNVEVSHSRPLVARLMEGKLDMLVARILDSEHAADLNFEQLSGEPHHFIVRAEHPLLSTGATLDLAQLVDQLWVMPSRGSQVRGHLQSLFVEQGLAPPQNTMETDDLMVIAALLMRTDAIAALPLETIRPYLDTGVLSPLPLDACLTMPPFGIITRREHRLSPGAENLLLALREAAGIIYPQSGSPPPPQPKRASRSQVAHSH